MSSKAGDFRRPGFAGARRAIRDTALRLRRRRAARELAADSRRLPLPRRRTCTSRRYAIRTSTCCRCSAKQGARLHANTPGDVYCGVRAGYDARDIVFSGSNVGEEDLAYLLGLGVHVNVDSLDDLRRACALVPGRDFGLRMHLEEVLPESRIGLRERDLDAALTLARRAGTRITSLHVYCGTHGQSLQRYRESLEKLVALAVAHARHRVHQSRGRLRLRLP